MAEYIDREAIMRQFADRVRRSNNSDFAPTPTWNQAVQIVEDYPAADVAKVRRGRWVANKEDVEWGNYLIRYQCSKCKERPRFDKDKYKFILSPYCPNCGAKMDEEKEHG